MFYKHFREKHDFKKVPKEGPKTDLQGDLFLIKFGSKTTSKGVILGTVFEGWSREEIKEKLIKAEVFCCFFCLGQLFWVALLGPIWEAILALKELVGGLSEMFCCQNHCFYKVLSKFGIQKKVGGLRDRPPGRPPLGPGWLLNSLQGGHFGRPFRGLVQGCLQKKGL